MWSSAVAAGNGNRLVRVRLLPVGLEPCRVIGEVDDTVVVDPPVGRRGARAHRAEQQRAGRDDQGRMAYHRPPRVWETGTAMRSSSAAGSVCRASRSAPATCLTSPRSLG